MSVVSEVKKTFRRWPWILLGVVLGGTVLAYPVALAVGKIKDLISSASNPGA